MSSTDFAKEAWRSYDDITLLKDDVRTVQGSAIGLNMSSRVATYQKQGEDSVYQIPYDFLVTATGTSRRWPVAPEAATRDDYLHDVDNLTQSVESAKRVVVVGGGMYSMMLSLSMLTFCRCRRYRVCCGDQDDIQEQRGSPSAITAAHSCSRTTSRLFQGESRQHTGLSGY